MRIALLCVGDELLDGRTQDTNASWLGQLLAEHARSLAATVTVGDDGDAIVDGLRFLAAQADQIVVSGGLGPTRDDVTREAIARFAGVDLAEDHDVLRRLRTFYQERGRSLDPINRRQAALPRGASAWPNPVGTAEPFEIRVGDCAILALPGVPREFRAAVEGILAPRITTEDHETRTLTFLGVTESAVAAWVEQGPPTDGLSISYLADFPYVRLRIRGAAQDAVQRVITHAVALGADHLLPGGARLAAEAVRDRCAALGARVATAESCTGGRVATLLTDLPGSSAWFDRGVVTYSNEAKTALLGVPLEVLAAVGAVSAEVAAAMCEGLRARAGVDAAVSVTGIAGPGGGSAAKPVGTVFLGVSTASGTVVVAACFPHRTRAMFRELVAALALRLLDRALVGDLGPIGAFAGVRSVAPGRADSPERG